MRIALTHARDRLGGLAGRLRALGHEVSLVPLIETKPVATPAARAAARALLGLSWRLYASRSAVEAWATLQLPFADGARLAAVGPATARALVEAGGRGVVVGVTATAEGLVEALAEATRERGVVGVVQGRRTRGALARGLRAQGFEPRVAVLYDTVPRTWRGRGAFDVVVLASPSAVAGLPRRVGENAVLVAIGPTTARAIEERGWRAVMAEAPTAQGVALAVQSVDAPSEPQSAPPLEAAP